MARIKFGTDGWRAVMAETFTFDNVRVVARAIARYVRHHGLAGRGIVIGYDTRFLSDKFAQAVAEVMVSEGIPVFLTASFCPTPVTAFAVIARRAAGAVMITASHNPPEYNGIKFIPEYGGPALPDVTDEIERYINELLAQEKEGLPGPAAALVPGAGAGQGSAVKMGEALAAGEVPAPGAAAGGVPAAVVGEGAAGEAPRGTGGVEIAGGTEGTATGGRDEAGSASATGGVGITRIDPREEYLAHLAKVIDVEGIRRRPLKVVVDSMYGCGMGYLEEFLMRAGCEVEMLHNHRDPLFGGIVPEPMGRWLKDLQEAVVQRGADLGLALDGDADRFGIVDRQGRYFTANEALYLYLEHLLRTRAHRGPVARTVATTHMLDRIAAAHGLAVEETAVGFKYIGQSLRERGAILGGEESGGMSMHGHIPEKDGILGAALMVELVAVEGRDPGELEEEIQRKYGPLVSERLDLHTTAAEKERIAARLKEFAPQEVAGFRVVGRNTVDGVKILLEGGRWALIRPSGTEPLFRLYVEAESYEVLRRIQDEVRMELGLFT